jgi:hypothetical protein
MSNNGFNRISTRDQSFIEHISRFIGEDVLIFTTSGGASGSGFEGTLLSVNSEFVRLLTEQGSTPTCPISDVCMNNHTYSMQGQGNHDFKTGSICDIPIDRIVNFTHNAV